jgi:hypothetical protein
MLVKEAMGFNSPNVSLGYNKAGQVVIRKAKYAVPEDYTPYTPSPRPAGSDHYVPSAALTRLRSTIVPGYTAEQFVEDLMTNFAEHAALIPRHAINVEVVESGLTLKTRTDTTPLDPRSPSFVYKSPGQLNHWYAILA